MKRVLTSWSEWVAEPSQRRTRSRLTWVLSLLAIAISLLIIVRYLRQDVFAPIVTAPPAARSVAGEGNIMDPT